MKGLLCALFLSAALVSVQAQTTCPDHSITVGFNQPVGTTTYPMQYCSPTLKAACVESYTETLSVPGTTQTVTQAIPAGSTDITGAFISHTWAPGGTLVCGTWNVSIVANWLDPKGVAIDSAALTGSVTEAVPFVAGPPAGVLTVTTNP